MANYQRLRDFWKKNQHLDKNNFTAKFKIPFLIGVEEPSKIEKEIDSVMNEPDDFEDNEPTKIYMPAASDSNNGESQDTLRTDKSKDTPKRDNRVLFNVWDEQPPGDETFNPLIIPITKRLGGDPHEITIGRTKHNDIVLPKGVISKSHAIFIIPYPGHDYLLEDLSSTNGTFINQKRLGPEAPQALKNGDMISFGIKLEFIYRTAEGFFDYLKNYKVS